MINEQTDAGRMHNDNSELEKLILKRDIIVSKFNWEVQKKSEFQMNGLSQKMMHVSEFQNFKTRVRRNECKQTKNN